MKSILFGDSPVSIGDAFYITIVSMLIVFFILFLISFVLSFFKYLSNDQDKDRNINKKSADERNTNKNSSSANSENERFSMGKVKDETMLAAMMAALIEAAGENEDCCIRVKNIREIQ